MSEDWNAQRRAPKRSRPNESDNMNKGESQRASGMLAPQQDQREPEQKLQPLSPAHHQQPQLHHAHDQPADPSNPEEARWRSQQQQFSQIYPHPASGDASLTAAAVSRQYRPPIHGHPYPPGNVGPTGHPQWQPQFGPGPPMHPYSGHGPPMGYPQYPGHAPPYGHYQQPPHMAAPYGYQEHPQQQQPPHGAYPGDMSTHSGSGMLGDKGDPDKGKLSLPKSRVSQDINDRRQRKNAQSRARASKLRDRIIDLQHKSEDNLTEEEMELLRNFEDRRQRKNDRSRERAIEKKSEMERILTKSERKRSMQEATFLDTSLKAKQRKNEGDRVRRQRIKQFGEPGKSTGGSSVSSSTGAGEGGKGAGGIGGQMPHHASFATGMPDIPMSPLPTVTGLHATQSPGTSFGESGHMMPNIRFPSPTNVRSSVAGTPTALETSSETHESQGVTGGTEPRHQGSGNAGFPSQGSSAGGYGDDSHISPEAKSQLHLPQNSSRVEQRRHADGSMTISIGGGGASFPGGDVHALGGDNGTSDIGEANLTDVSHLLLYSENGEEVDVQKGGQPNIDAV